MQVVQVITGKIDSVQRFILGDLLSILCWRGEDIEPLVSKDVREMTVDDSVLQLELNMTPSTRTLGTPL